MPAIRLLETNDVARRLGLSAERQLARARALHVFAITPFPLSAASAAWARAPEISPR